MNWVNSCSGFGHDDSTINIGVCVIIIIIYYYYQFVKLAGAAFCGNLYHTQGSLSQLFLSANSGVFCTQTV